MHTHTAHMSRNRAYGLVAHAARTRVARKLSSNRLEVLWAWASLLVLIVCWDAALRLDQHVQLPRRREIEAISDQH
jgi:hypothetical protein